VEQLDQLRQRDLRELALDARLAVADAAPGRLRALLAQERLDEARDRLGIGAARHTRPSGDCVASSRSPSSMNSMRIARVCGIGVQDLREPRAVDQRQRHLHDHRGGLVARARSRARRRRGRRAHVDAERAARRRDLAPAVGVAVRDQHDVAI
jgi:hypothetical protein